MNKILNSRSNCVGVELKKAGGSSGFSSDEEDDFDDSTTDSPSPHDDPADLSTSSLLASSLLGKRPAGGGLLAAFGGQEGPLGTPALNPILLNMMMTMNPAFLGMLQLQQQQQPQLAAAAAAPSLAATPPATPATGSAPKRSRLMIDEILNLKTAKDERHSASPASAASSGATDQSPNTSTG